MAPSKGRLALGRENLLTAARLLGALVLAGLADQAFRNQQPVWDRLIFLAGAVGLFLWATYRLKGLEAPFPPLKEGPPLSTRRWAMLGLAISLALLAWPAFAGNRLQPLGLVLLAGAIACLALAGRQGRDQQAPPPRGDLLAPRVRHLALLGIVLLGALFRLYRLDMLPSDMFNDLAHIWKETERVLEGEWMIYGTVFPGREPLLFYLNALLAQIVGLRFFTLKLSTALVGIATVPVVYLLGREAYSDAAGLGAALFLALSKWHVLLSRVGFRAILTPLTTALCLYFLLRGLRRGRRADFVWAGVWGALGLYGYTSALAVIPAVVIGLGLHALSGHARDLWRMRWALLLALLLALIIALPLLRFMLVDGAEQFWMRPRTRYSEAEATLPGPRWQIWWGNLVRAAGMFNFQGDVVFRTNIPYDPHLGVVAGPLFLLGFFLILARWRRGGNALLLSFFIWLLIPSTLALAFPREVPSAVRAGGALATVTLFPAVAVVAAWQRLARAIPDLRTSWGWSGLLAGLALWSGLYNAHLCFEAYPQVLPAENYPLFRQIAHVIDEFGDDGPVLLKSVPHWDDKDAIRRQSQYHPEWGYHGEILTTIDPAFFAQLPAQQGGVIVNPERDQEALQQLRQIFPQGISLVYRDDQGRPQFVLFFFHKDKGP